MMRHVLMSVLLAALLLPLASGAAMAQEQKRTLWDMLFGEPQQQQTVRQQPRRTTTPKRAAPQRQSRSRASTPAPPPRQQQTVDKTSDAKQLAVFGDSLSIDLARALERFFADDPNIEVSDRGVGSSGIVRDDFYDWPATIAKAIAADDFDIAVILVGINDRQNLRVNGASLSPLTDAWKQAYTARLNGILDDLRAAGKPVIWVGLPPMRAPTYSNAITQIASVQRLAVISSGASYVDIFDRFADEDGNYAVFGPDINGVSEQMRKSDGIHFTNAGSDKLAFYVSQAMKGVYQGGNPALAVSDPLADTDAANMVRPPLQGIGQIRHLEVAGAIIPLENSATRAGQLIDAAPGTTVSAGFSLADMMKAPEGRVDAFGESRPPKNSDKSSGLAD